MSLRDASGLHVTVPLALAVCLAALFGCSEQEASTPSPEPAPPLERETQPSAQETGAVDGAGTDQQSDEGRLVPLDLPDWLTEEESHGEERAEEPASPSEPPPADPEAIAELLDELATAEEEEDRIGVMLALAEYGPGAREAFAPLRAALTEDSVEVRSVAAFALGRLGRAAAAAVDELLMRLGDEAAQVRQAAAFALGQIGGEEAGYAAPHLRRRLEEDPDSQVRAVAAHALTRLGEAALEPLLVGYDDLPADRRAYRLALLGKLGPAATEALDTFIAALEDESIHVVLAAVRALARVGEAAHAAAPALLATWEASEEEELTEACEAALREMGAAAVPAIVAALEQAMELRGHEGHRRRIALIEQLGKLEAEAAEGVSVLVANVAREEPLAVRVAAITALGRIGTAAGEAARASLETALRDESTVLQAAAARALAALGKPGIEALGRALQHASVEEQALHEVLILALFELGEEAAPAVSGLAEALRRDELSSTLRYTVVRTLYLIGPPAREATPLLIRAMHERDSAVAETAAEALGAIGRPALRALPAMLSGVRDGRLGYLRAGQAMAKFGSPAVSTLLARADDPNEAVRATVFEALGRIGPGEQRGLAALIEGSRDEDPLVRGAAVRAMLRYQEAAATHPAAIEALLERIGPEEPEEVIRLAAIRTLGHSGERAGRVVEPIAAQLEDGASAVRREAASTLAVLGEAAQPVAHNLARAFFEDEEWEVAEAASVALIELGPGAGFAQRRLRRALFAEKEMRRLAATRVLAGIGEEAGAAVPDLITVLEEDEQPLVRSEAAAALGAMGSEARDAVPALIAAVDHPVIGPRAIQALGRIGPAAGEATEPILARLAHEESKQLALIILEALGNIGPAAEAALEPLLQVATTAQDETLREAAARALRQIEPQ